MTIWIVLVVVGVFALQFWTATTIWRLNWDLWRRIAGGRSWLVVAMVLGALAVFMLGLLSGLGR